MLAAETAEETVDDPLWSQELEEQESEEEEDQLPPPPPTKKRRTVKTKSKEEKLTKCPHCLREFTNLKHHINQQHAQVRSGPPTHVWLIFSVEELQVCRVWLQLLPQDRPRETSDQRAREAEDAVSGVWQEIQWSQAAHQTGPWGPQGIKKLNWTSRT